MRLILHIPDGSDQEEQHKLSQCALRSINHWQDWEEQGQIWSDGVICLYNQDRRIVTSTSRNKNSYTVRAYFEDLANANP